jgi:glycosyltransferase involved in cell wall biosynthesis
MKRKKNNNQPIKIVCLTPRLFVGGAERLMIDIFSRLDRQRFQPLWCCLEADSDELVNWRAELEKNDIAVTILTNKQRPNNKIGRLWRLIAIGWRLWRYLRKTQPDIVQTQLFADIYRPIAKLAGVPTVIGVEHNLDYDEPAWTRWAKLIGRWSITGIIAVSWAVKQDIVRRYRYSSDKVEVIYNGIDWDKFFKPIIGSNLSNPVQSTWRLGAIGRLTEQKGFDILIKALAKLPQDISWQCSIAGTGPQADYLNSLIIKFGLSDKIKLIGLQADVPRFLNSLDWLIVPSRWEGLGLVILEAGAAGVPVLASQADGIKEIISHKYSGYLILPGGVDELADGLVDVLTKINQSDHLVWAQNLQKKVEKNFSIIMVVKQYQNYYERFRQ